MPGTGKDPEKYTPPVTTGDRTVKVEHRNKINKVKASLVAGTVALGAVAGATVYNEIRDLRQMIEADANQQDYSPIPGVGIAQDILDIEEEPVNVNDLVLEEAESLGASGFGVQPVSFTAEQSVIARTLKSVGIRQGVSIANIIPGVNRNLPDGEWEPILHAWTDVSGFTFASAPQEALELSIEENDIDSSNNRNFDTPPANPETNSESYTVNIAITEVELLDTLVQFPEDSDYGRAGYSMLNGRTGDFVEVQDPASGQISDVEETWRGLFNIGVGNVEPPNTYQIAREGTNIVKEELLLGGHVGMVALAAACDMANNVENGLSSYTSALQRDGVIDSSVRFEYRTDVGQAMDSFKDNLMTPHMTNADGSYGPVDPGQSLLQASTLSAIEDIPTDCAALDAQPVETDVLIESAEIVDNEAALAALRTRGNGSQDVSTVSLTEPVDMGIISVEPIRAE